MAIHRPVNAQRWLPRARHHAVLAAALIVALMVPITPTPQVVVTAPSARISLAGPEAA